MTSLTRFRKLLAQIHVVRPPQHRLATFGSTKITYTLITDVPGLADRAKIRTGEVVAERPAIIAPQALADRFFGFGEEAQTYARWLTTQYGDALRGLEYNFKNSPMDTRVELVPPETLTARMAEEFDRVKEYRRALIRGTDTFWELSVMKLIIEETLSSFTQNVRELDERGFFDPEDRVVARRQREIQTLLQKARLNKSLLPALGQKLKEYEMFEQYQDEFFQLMKS